MDLAQSQLHTPTDREVPRNWMPTSKDMVTNELKNLSEFSRPWDSVSHSFRSSVWPITNLASL